MILAALLADGYLRREGLDGPEFYVLMLLSASGGMVMAVGQRPHRACSSASRSCRSPSTCWPPCTCAGSSRRRRPSSTSCSARSRSAFFLYGIALVYGATGSTEPRRRSPTFLADAPSLDATTALLLAGLGAAARRLRLQGRGGAVPLLDARRVPGLAEPVVAFMASGVKAAGFAGLLRVLRASPSALPAATGSRSSTRWPSLTLLVGAVLAVVQTDVKRMLAYSSISHAGFILVGVQAAIDRGHRRRALLPGRLHVHGRPAPSASSPSSAARATAHHRSTTTGAWPARSPLLALAFTVFLLAQAGVPFTSGFFAKFYVIDAAVEARSYWLALVAMVSAVIAAFLYLRIVLAMYAGPDEDEAEAPRRPRRPAPHPQSRRPPPSPWSWPSSPPSASAWCPTPSPTPPRTPPPSSSPASTRPDLVTPMPESGQRTAQDWVPPSSMRAVPVIMRAASEAR